MEIFIATQPIFDRNRNVYAYEILYRRNNINAYDASSGADEASSKVMIGAFQTMGLDKLTNGKPAFINFTDRLVKEGVATLFPKEKLVVELLETITPDSLIIEKCKELKQKGYQLALDDFVMKEEFLPLIELADIIKIDFLVSSRRECADIVKTYGPKGIRFLAEKIETNEDYKFAMDIGYTYFQGYFFSKPLIRSTKDISPLKFNYLKLLTIINQPETEFKDLETIISRDISLTYKLLKLVNSPGYGFVSTIKSIRQALTILGEKELRKWISLIALRGIGEDVPNDLLKKAIIRGRFMELTAKKSSLSSHSLDLFSLGLFSMIDMIMGQPKEEILQDIKLPVRIYDALFHQKGTYYDFLNLIINYENAAWDEVSRLLETCGINEGVISDAYVNAILWSNDILNLS